MVEPVVTALGHAGLCVEAQGVRLLLDPWVSRSGAFLGSWFPFPDNEHLPGPWLAGADLVVVSHEHLDHLDLDFLAQLPAPGADRGAPLPLDDHRAPAGGGRTRAGDRARRLGAGPLRPRRLAHGDTRSSAR